MSAWLIILAEVEMENSDSKDEQSPSERVDRIIADHGDWRGETSARMRNLIKAADPDVVEECKWARLGNPSDVPVWSHAGIICTGESYRTKIKLTFARYAMLADPAGLFNSSLDGKVRRANDIVDSQCDRRAVTNRQRRRI